MSKTNCPKCGTAKDVLEIKCPFCGTAFLDMTAIAPYKLEPMWLKGPDGSVYQIKAYPTVANFTIEPEAIEVRSINGFWCRARARNEVRISLEFEGVIDHEP